ncbi:hypothetical protein F4677DRAFT_189754 [Hypoxylon crocopeplum]|nr:hypothetical protein F4677DRAFT_189754 [Hypoxylon crocopeplum]
MVPFVPFITGGAIMFGISLSHGAPWPLVVVKLGIGHFGLIPINTVTITYITDAYTKIAGDALVGVMGVRSIVGTIFVFALSPWVERMGIKYVIVTATLI